MLLSFRTLGCQLAKNAVAQSRLHSPFDSLSLRRTTRQVTGLDLPHLFRSSSPRLCSTIALMASSTPFSDKAPEEYRLPLEVKPTHYDVTLRTDLAKLTFDGFVKIE